MVHQSVTIRVLAENTKSLRRPRQILVDRERFSEYVKLYREMAEDFAQAESAAERDAKQH